MAGKAKPTKHTTKEINAKHHAAKMKNGGMGGGAEGKEKRKAPKEGKSDVHTKLKCVKCLALQPSIKSMMIHYESKHPKEDWEAAKVQYLKDEEENNKNNVEIKKYNNYQEYKDDHQGENEDDENEDENEEENNEECKEEEEVPEDQ